MIIKHAAAAFLQKAFGHGINADEQLNNPEQPDPGPVVRVFDGHVQDKDGSANVEKHTIKRILLANFQQQVFFEEGNYLFIRFQKVTTERSGTVEKCLSFENRTALFMVVVAAIIASGSFNFVC